MFIETHAHIEKKTYEDISKLIKESKEMGIEKIVSAGTDAKTNEEAVNFSTMYPEIYACVGIHPELASIYKKEDLDLLFTYAANPKVIAIGEIGLDYHYDGYDKEKQIMLLEKQLEIASELNLPVVIHSRDATADTIATLQKFPQVKGVIHSFSGSKETGEIYIKMGYKLGVNGVVTFKNAKTKEIVKSLGIENYVLETDSPFLTPEPFRGHQNFPRNIKFIAEFLAGYLEMPVGEIGDITSENAYEIFDKLK